MAQPDEFYSLKIAEVYTDLTQMYNNFLEWEISVMSEMESEVAEKVGLGRGKLRLESAKNLDLKNVHNKFGKFLVDQGYMLIEDGSVFSRKKKYIATEKSTDLYLLMKAHSKFLHGNPESGPEKPVHDTFETFLGYLDSGDSEIPEVYRYKFLSRDRTFIDTYMRVYESQSSDIMINGKDLGEYVYLNISKSLIKSVLDHVVPSSSKKIG